MALAKNKSANVVCLMNNISIIIVTYNSFDLIKDCIDSIFKYNDIGDEAIEIIIVDNSARAVTDKMFQYLKELYGEKIVLIKNKENLGYGQGNNVGIENAKHEIICIMNPDVRLKEPIFLKTINEFKRNINLGLLGYKQIGGFNLSFYLKQEYDLSFLSYPIGRFVNKFNYFNPQYFYLSGAFFFIDKMKFNRIGNFDKNIFLYCEESDISHRLLENKFEIKFNKNYEYIHLIGDCSSYSEFIFNNWFISTKYYLKKYRLNEKIYFKKIKIDALLKILFSKFISNKTKETYFRKKYLSLVALLKDNQTNGSN